MHICVIGAGVVGVTTAYFLSEAGHQVTLVDAAADAAHGASFANGGQLSFSYVAPLAGPGVLGDVPRWLLNRDAPLRFLPRLDGAVAPLAPKISVTDYERRIVYARVGPSLRIAAMVDIGSRDASIDTARIATLKRQVKEAFPDLSLDNAQPWAGLRPATATGCPAIGAAPSADNLYLISAKAS